MEKDKAVIYAVKTGDTCHYIGKTIKESAEGKITKSLIANTYQNEGLIKVFEDHKDIVIEPLLLVDIKEWYDEKLHEVVQKHKDDHPLVNAQWMLDGKRGIEYWRGKKRDAHTLKCLSESKYIRVCQYDKDGVLVRVWKGGKEAAIEVFGDYKLVNNSGKTDLYNAIRAKYVKNKFKMGYYWFREKDLIRYFNLVPTKLNIDAIHQAEQKRKRETRKKQVNVFTTRYTVQQFNKYDKLIRTFDNTAHCGYELKVSMGFVQRICSGKRSNNNYLLAFGPKLRQPSKQEYPDYKIKIKPQIKIPKFYKPTRTRRVVYHYKNGVLIQTYGSVKECAKRLYTNESLVRRHCANGTKHFNRVLVLGEKRTVKI